MNFHDYLEYQNGCLYWKQTVNRRHAHKGDRAGIQRPDLYRTITLFGKKYLEHRLIYFIHHGTWPKYLDHINRDKSDNRIENLRDVKPRDNSLNHKNNSQTPNICFHYGKFQLIIKGKYIGRYSTLEEAQISRDNYVEQ